MIEGSGVGLNTKIPDDLHFCPLLLLAAPPIPIRLLGQNCINQNTNTNTDLKLKTCSVPYFFNTSKSSLRMMK